MNYHQDISRSLNFFFFYYIQESVLSAIRDPWLYQMLFSFNLFNENSIVSYLYNVIGEKHVYFHVFFMLSKWPTTIKTTSFKTTSFLTCLYYLRILYYKTLISLSYWGLPELTIQSWGAMQIQEEFIVPGCWCCPAPKKGSTTLGRSCDKFLYSLQG